MSTPLPAFIKVLVVQEIRKGTGKNGKPYEFQEVDCLTLDADGVELQVGVTPVPAPLVGKITRGLYAPVYGMRVDFQSRKIMPAIVDFTPVPSLAPVGRAAPVAAAPAAPKA